MGVKIKDVQQGDTVILRSFSGIKLGVFEVASATESQVKILCKNGDEMIFDRKTGRQLNPKKGKEGYASKIVEDDGSYVRPTGTGRKAKVDSKPRRKKVR